MSENFESVKLRCLVDTERAKRDDCPPLSELREATIRLAWARPELRAHVLPLLTKEAAMPHPDRKETERVKRLIMDKFAPKGEFSMHDVYMDDAQPKDLNMYDAFDELVEEGRLRRVDRFAPAQMNHDQMRYRRASTLHDDVVRLAYTKPELRADLLPLITAHTVTAAAPLVHSLSDVKPNGPARERIVAWVESFDLDDPEAAMMGGKGHFEANPNKRNELRTKSVPELRTLLSKGNNTTYLGVARMPGGRTKVHSGRGYLAAMPSFDARAAAAQGFDCVRVDDAYHIWCCYVLKD